MLLRVGRPLSVSISHGIRFRSLAPIGPHASVLTHCQGVSRDRESATSRAIPKGVACSAGMLQAHLAALRLLFAAPGFTHHTRLCYTNRAVSLHRCFR